MRCHPFGSLIFIFAFSLFFTDTVRARPDSPALIGVMGGHGHKTGEVRVSYRFMAMGIWGLQSGTEAVDTVAVLKDFRVAPTAMNMKMHMFGAMFAPPDTITLMAMTGYQERHMEMEGSSQHAIGHPVHSMGGHEVSSAGIG